MLKPVHVEKLLKGIDYRYIFYFWRKMWMKCFNFHMLYFEAKELETY